MRPCGECANCRNGAPGICLALYPELLKIPKGPPRDHCGCGKPLYGRDRLCPSCRLVHRRQTKREYQRCCRCGQFTKKGLAFIGRKGPDLEGAGTLVLRHVPTRSDEALRA